MRVRFTSLVAIFMRLICIAGVEARQIPSWSVEELSNSSDLVVVAELVSTSDAPKAIIAGRVHRDYFQPVLTTLDVLYVLKGQHPDNRLVVVHNRLNLKGQWISNGPRLMTFLEHETYIVFLKRRPDGPLEPVVDFDSGASLKQAYQHSAPTAVSLDRLWSDLDARPGSQAGYERRRDSQSVRAAAVAG